jgi:lauroyl/myristoyl acyltransferase
VSRALRAAHEMFMETCRTLARFVPPLLLHVLLLPYELIRGVPAALAQRDLPLRHIPPRPDDGPPGFFARWRFQSRNYERWLATLWLDLWQRPPWSNRLRIENGQIIDRALADRPVVLAGLHTGWHFASAVWLLSRGVEIGSVIAWTDQWQRAEELRDSDYWDRYRGSSVFLKGDTRSMVRFLTPGRCFLVQVDSRHSKQIEVEWRGAFVQLGSGAFRLARLANAVVVPIVALDDGLWRYRVHVGAPVPDELIAAGDDLAAAGHVVRELLPLVAEAPDQLMVAHLFRAADSATDQAATDSGFGREALTDR